MADRETRLEKARFTVNLLAVMVALGEVSERHAYDHVADTAVLCAVTASLDDLVSYFETRLKELGGVKRPRPPAGAVVSVAAVTRALRAAAKRRLREAEQNARKGWHIAAGIAATQSAELDVAAAMVETVASKRTAARRG